MASDETSLSRSCYKLLAMNPNRRRLYKRARFLGDGATNDNDVMVQEWMYGGEGVWFWSTNADGGHVQFDAQHLIVDRILQRTARAAACCQMPHDGG